LTARNGYHNAVINTRCQIDARYASTRTESLISTLCRKLCNSVSRFRNGE